MYIVYDCIFSDFPAKNTVYTPYMNSMLANAAHAHYHFVLTHHAHYHFVLTSCALSFCAHIMRIIILCSHHAHYHFVLTSCALSFCAHNIMRIIILFSHIMRIIILYSHIMQIMHLWFNATESSAAFHSAV